MSSFENVKRKIIEMKSIEFYLINLINVLETNATPEKIFTLHKTYRKLVEIDGVNSYNMALNELECMIKTFNSQYFDIIF